MADNSTRANNPDSDVILSEIKLHTILHFKASEPKFRENRKNEIMTVVFDKRRRCKQFFPHVLVHTKHRCQVGHTNRWRMDTCPSSDILGSTQALKSVTMAYNKGLMKKITAESASTSLNIDMNEPYRFRQNNDRPFSMPAPTVSSESIKHICERPVSIPHLPGLSAKDSKLLGLSKVHPPSVNPTNPRDVLKYHKHKGRTFTGPDLRLYCLSIDWDLHKTFMYKSETLAALMASCNIAKSTSSLSCPSDSDTPLPNSLRPKIQKQDEMRLSVEGMSIRKHGLAVALGNLYHEDLEVNPEDLTEVLPAAIFLKFHPLEAYCADMMKESISYSTVCCYHDVASKHNQDSLVQACEQWLELNLIPQLSTQIHLRELTMPLLMKIINSLRLFTFNEYSVYKLLTYWMFLHLNPSIQLMPSHSTVLAFYHGFNRTSLLESDEGCGFEPLFSALRLHGITDSDHIQDIQTMNVLPQKWIIDFLSRHYQALQCGGDMATQKNFQDTAIRQGFILDDEPRFHNEVLSLHGFHFMLQAQHSPGDDTYQFYLRRLKPNDSVLSFRQCERHTFSLRPDRLALYAIRVQYTSPTGQIQLHDTGPVIQRFGLSSESSKSQVLTLEGIHTPIHVTFMVIFPTS